MKLWWVLLHTLGFCIIEMSPCHFKEFCSPSISEAFPLPQRPTSTAQTSLCIHTVWDIAAVIPSEYAKVKPRCLGDQGELTLWGNARWTSFAGALSAYTGNAGCSGLSRLNAPSPAWLYCSFVQNFLTRGNCRSDNAHPSFFLLGVADAHLRDPHSRREHMKYVC